MLLLSLTAEQEPSLAQSADPASARPALVIDSGAEPTSLSPASRAPQEGSKRDFSDRLNCNKKSFKYRQNLWGKSFQSAVIIFFFYHFVFCQNSLDSPKVSVLKARVSVAE